MPPKKVDPRIAKEKKQKKIAAVGAVILVGVLGIQVPRMLKLMGGDDAPVAPAAAATAPATTAPTPATTPAPGGDPTLAPPTLAGGNPTEAAESPEQPASAEAATQLVTFSSFASKDPFAPQVVAGSSAPAEPKTEDAGGGEAAPAPGGAEPSPTPATPTSAVLRVDGVRETVAVNASFPAAGPAFLLVSLAKGSATIGVAEGGSFAAGGGTLKLTKGDPVTLVNTADGTRYVVELVSVG